jgi:tRNA-binding EMAP/Myf-like protein
MPRRGKKHGTASAPTEREGWVCPDCAQDNGKEDGACIACDALRPVRREEEEEEEVECRHPRCICGVVTSCEELPGGLKKLDVDIGEVSYFISGELEPVTVVTAATNVEEGSAVIVALDGAKVQYDDAFAVTVKRRPYGGVMSEGLLCSDAMLGWRPAAAPVGVVGPAHRGKRRGGGGSGDEEDVPAPMVTEAFLLPASFAFKPGDGAPDEKPA